MPHCHAFEAFRTNTPAPITLLRLIAGALLVVICWIVTTFLTILPGISFAGSDFADLMTSNIGMMVMLLSFSGIWIGVWLAARFIHRDRLGNVLGATGRLSWSDFGKGFVAIILTSILSELTIYMIRPEFSRSAIDLSAWLIAFIPVALLCLVQTSAEELFFRGYLLRGLANRFRSPWIWGLLPGLGFLLIHWQPEMAWSDVFLTLLTIGALTILLVALVYVTGNLGASFGVHMGNNLMAFLVVGHQDSLTYYALFSGAQLADGSTTTDQITILVITGWACVAIAAWLLLNRRSPLRVGAR